MGVSKRVRFEVLRRDNYTCRYCRSTDNPLTVDHVVPVALGGSDEPSNLVAACKDCNFGKASSSPDASTVADVSEDALRWAAALRLAAQQAADQQQALEERLLPFWDRWYTLVPSYRLGNHLWELPSNWKTVVAGLLDGGLSEAMLLEGAEIALTTRGVDDRFRYFLGITRNMLAKLQDAARQLIADGAV